MEWLVEEASHANAGLSVARMTIEPQTTSELHQHSNCSEVIYVLSGNIEQRIGQNWVQHTTPDGQYGANACSYVPFLF